jgi:hypothetical protein
MIDCFTVKVAIAAIATTLSLTALWVTPAQAAIIEYNFSFTLPNSEPAPGARGEGSFSFDDSSVNPALVFQGFPLSSFQLSLLERTFTLEDVFAPPTAQFFSGNFAGIELELDLTSDNPFPFSAFRISGSQYEGIGFSGVSTGPVFYSQVVIPISPDLPTPALLPGLVGFGFATWQRRDKQVA